MHVINYLSFQVESDQLELTIALHTLSQGELNCYSLMRVA